jgi:glycosyltransferase involved in cell wall biosynthesis
VIATFNMSEFLSTAVKSALAQTYPNIEVLVVDDGSTDDTSEVMRQFASDSRVRYIGQQNQGQAAAKNRGIQEARGELVAFLDADDFWREDKLALQAALFENAPSVGVVYSQFVEVDREGRLGQIAEAQCFRGRVTGPLLVFNFIAFGTSVVRKACFDRLGIFRTDLGMGIDYELWLRFSVEWEFDYVAQPLLYYRVWSGQMSKNCRRRYQNGMDTMRRFLAQHPDLVDRTTVKRAWAETHLGLAWCLFTTGADRRSVLAEMALSLSFRPFWLATWRAIFKVCLFSR